MRYSRIALKSRLEGIGRKNASNPNHVLTLFPRGNLSIPSLSFTDLPVNVTSAIGPWRYPGSLGRSVITPFLNAFSNPKKRLERLCHTCQNLLSGIRVKRLVVQIPVLSSQNFVQLRSIWDFASFEIYLTSVINPAIRKFCSLRTQILKNSLNI